VDSPTTPAPITIADCADTTSPCFVVDWIHNVGQVFFEGHAHGESRWLEGRKSLEIASFQPFLRT